jgi:hypothetical protein
MDSERIKEAAERLTLLDERLGHQLRPHRGGSLVRVGTEQLEERLKHLTDYTLELRSILEQILLALAS